MNNELSRDQRGLVSFMVTLIMMMVISLIAIGFTQVTNSNRREQLDRQLSMQAFYAAESGVNVAAGIVKASAVTGVKAQTSCGDTTYPAATLSTSPSVAYTCVLVNPNVPSIITNANQQKSSVFKVRPVDSAGNSVVPASLTFTWSVAQGMSASNCTTQTLAKFPKNDTTYTCPFGLLRVDLVQGSTGSSAAAFASNTTTLFIQPVGSGGSAQTISSFSSPKAIIVGGTYDSSSKVYKATVNLGVGARASEYYARITTLYRDSPRIVVDGTSTTGSSLNFADAQAIIDVTGKAQDVLRRVQVTIPLQQYDTNLIPEGAIQSVVDVCKQFTIYGGSNAYNGCPGS